MDKYEIASMEQIASHLNMVQRVIDRMAANSLSVRWQCLVMVLGIMSISGAWGVVHNMHFLILPIWCFWYLNAYFLRQERLYRCLYNSTIKGIRLFSLNTKRYDLEVPSIFATMFSITLITFYTGLLMSILMVVI